MMGLALLGSSLSVTGWAGNAAWPLDPSRLGLLKETSILLGQPIRNTEGKTLGKVDDLLVDLGSSQVIVALVSGGNGQTTPVPAMSIPRVYRDYAELPVDKKIFGSAPRLPALSPAGTTQMKSLVESFRYFSQKEPELPAAPGELISASRLLGARLFSQANEPLGEIKDIMVDVPLGRIVYLVVAPAASPAGDYYVVPPVSVRADAANRALVLQFDRAHFAAGPRFQKDFGSDISFPQLAFAVQQHYRLQPVAATGTNNASAVAMAAASAPAAPARSDRELTRAVLAEIVHESNGLEALNLMVTSVNGRVTIRGNVRNEKQAKLVIAAAERVAGAGNVEDQMQYRGRKAAVR